MRGILIEMQKFFSADDRGVLDAQVDSISVRLFLSCGGWPVSKLWYRLSEQSLLTP
jgi:hypothetical protein